MRDRAPRRRLANINHKRLTIVRVLPKGRKSSSTLRWGLPSKQG